jgi:hypothetical protein
LAAVTGCGKPKKAAETPPPATVSETPVDSSTPTPVVAEPASLNPCELVPQADAESLADTPLEAGNLIDNGNYATCTYLGPVTGPTAQVEVYIGDAVQKALDINRGLGHDFVTLDGVGDEAYLEDFNVYVRKGANWGWVRLVRLEDPEGFNKPLEELARKMASQM